MGCLYSLLLNQLNFLVSNLLYSSRAGRLTMICGGHNRVTASLSSNFQDAGMYPMIPRTALAAPTTPITPSLQGPPKSAVCLLQQEPRQPVHHHQVSNSNPLHHRIAIQVFQLAAATHPVSHCLSLQLAATTSICQPLAVQRILQHQSVHHMPIFSTAWEVPGQSSSISR